MALLLFAISCKDKGTAIPGLVTHYNLDGNGNDIGPMNLTATVSGATPSDDRNGKPNHAFYFDGIDDFIQFPFNSDAKEFPLTVSFWAKFDQLTANILTTDNQPDKFSGVFFALSKVVETENHLVVSYGNGGGIFASSRKTL